MYKITFQRKNFNKKGCFVKKFFTLSELAKYFVHSHQKLCIPYLNKELTKKERYILIKKINAIINS